MVNFSPPPHRMLVSKCVPCSSLLLFRRVFLRGLLFFVVGARSRGFRKIFLRYPVPNPTFSSLRFLKCPGVRRSFARTQARFYLSPLGSFWSELEGQPPPPPPCNIFFFSFFPCPFLLPAGTPPRISSFRMIGDTDVVLHVAGQENWPPPSLPGRCSPDAGDFSHSVFSTFRYKEIRISRRFSGSPTQLPPYHEDFRDWY